ncbi:GNAT family N-acetyltransferase [Saccharibacter sp. 17.LH.SD]|uniref:GNAT family N-acetyltransferase n=1 Tax=Saccharibacter sp. 17.LH.SD TaxID=2689393 RepID=UPI001369EC3D|nr:GNAT family N-acetyltransferase [Saccharibacter sp. 17.LH.SD]MXV44883.1 GNAT family N-acetyltransferase [Saccharibacter sp. 17.LH.SD]
MMFSIRDAQVSDIPGITQIYNDAVLNTTAIWNDSIVDDSNRIKWLDERLKAGFPVIVAGDNQESVIGYGSFGDWRAWDGYRHTVEHSVYVRSDQRRKGVGKALMLALLDRARACGKHVMVAGVTSENTASIRLHEDLGFKVVGNLPEVGTKFGRWLDLMFLQFTLNKKDATR